ncbi:Hpt domain-containing protein [Azospirillum sp. sgz302134]
MPDRDAFEARLAELRAGFAARLRRDARDIADAAARLDRDPEAAERIRSLAHRLSGTAGSFGFAEAGRIAGRIETLAEAPTNGARHALADAVAALRALAEREG